LDDVSEKIRLCNALLIDRKMSIEAEFESVYRKERTVVPKKYRFVLTMKLYLDYITPTHK